MWDVKYGMAAALITGMALFTVGCTGAGADSGKGGGQGSQASSEDDGYKYRQCLRDNGVKVEEPKDGMAAGVEVKDEKAFKKAEEACKGMPGAGKEMNEEEAQQALDKAVDYAKCMRENGVDMPDPTMKDGKLTAQRGDTTLSKDKIEKAQKACSDQNGR
ncbi:hypothetical protein ACFYN3_34510 [Streptomyces lavendulae]|uniref:hypothetical protein n=1 Tax=Streptomyces lavendulae TaxID=1914 RepID=UPI0036B2C878